MVDRSICMVPVARRIVLGLAGALTPFAGMQSPAAAQNWFGDSGQLPAGIDLTGYQTSCAYPTDTGQTGFGVTAVPDLPKGTTLSALMLQMHNDERKRFGVEDLNWDNDLAADAQAYATYLLTRTPDGQLKQNTGWLIHYGEAIDAGATGVPVPKVKVFGENLAGGSANGTGADAKYLANLWLLESKFFRDGLSREGAYSDSKTCNTAHVGHYTQMIWRNTTKVGCGIATVGDRRVLACRYKQPGNVLNERPFPRGSAGSWPAIPVPADTTRAEPNFQTTVEAKIKDMRTGANLAPLTWSADLANAASMAAADRIKLDQPWSPPVSGGEMMGTAQINSKDETVYPTSMAAFDNSLSMDFQRGRLLVAGVKSVGCAEATERHGMVNWRVVICRYQ